VSERLFNLLDVDVEQDARSREGNEIVRAMLGQRAGATETGFGLYELAPGQGTWAYHYELNREEWLIVVSGEIVVRTPEGDVTMRAGDVRCFPIGPAGAHSVRNETSEPARYAMPSSWAGHAYLAVYPDSNKALIAGEHFRQIVSLDESLDYWDREP
jgi:uncharacterized cupin superfamily protein